MIFPAIAILLFNIKSATPINVSKLPQTSDVSSVEIGTEDEPAASVGNNLNVAVDSQLGFQAISTIYNEKTENTDENGNVKSLSTLVTQETNSVKDNEHIVESQPLVWDNCYETSYRDHNKVILENHKDMEIDRDIQVRDHKNMSSSWNKRDVPIKSGTMETWYEKNDSKKTKADERRQQKIDSIFIKKITETTTSPIFVQVIPITIKMFEEIELPNVPEEIVTENSVTSYTEDWFEARDRSKIRFSSLPQTESYSIPALKLDEGFYPFSFMSEFFSLIYPIEFPVGLIKDIFWGKVIFPYSFIQSIKVESAFLAFIIVFCCIALIIPSYLLILGFLSLLSRSSCDDEVENGALFPDAEDTECNDRILVAVTLLVVLLCCIFISGMVVSNEQARDAAIDRSNFISCACGDIASWLSAAARELHHSIVPPVDLVMYAYREDLRNVEALLGEPIQKAIASESGIDMVLDSLTDIVKESEDLSSKISSLRDISVRAGALASAASDRVKELARQLDTMKKYCTSKDLPLCDTVNTHSLEILLKFDLILHENQLLELRTLGVENLTRAISTAKQEFRTLPSAISTQTTQVREAILRDVEARRLAVHTSSRILTDIMRHLTAGLHKLARELETHLDRVQTYELWRWSLMLACIVLFIFVMTLILLAMMCGCGKAKEHAKRTLKISSLWICFASLVLWAMISAVFLIAGHAEVYVCHALWDFPQYKTLSALLDRPSPLLKNNEGIFDAMFRELENVTLDVSVKDVLRDCEQNRPAYIVFNFDKVLDVNKETSYFEWEELQRDLGRLASSLDVGLLKTISAYFSKLLNGMLRVSDVDIAKYRMDYNSPVVGKDLPSLADQLGNVAAQVTDLTTAGRLETLATRTQRLYTSSIKPLEQLRADVVYKLTELELQLMPFRRKLNISLSHIHTAQYYIDNQGEIIAQKKVSIYVARLISHAASWRMHVLTSVGQHAARCRPLYAVYSAARSLLCTRYVSSLHGWWICGLLLGLVWCTTLTPLCVKLWRSYNSKIRAHEALSLANLGSGNQETPTTALCEGSNWNTPGPPPPRNDSW